MEGSAVASSSEPVSWAQVLGEDSSGDQTSIFSSFKNVLANNRGPQQYLEARCSDAGKWQSFANKLEELIPRDPTGMNFVLIKAGGVDTLSFLSS